MADINVPLLVALGDRAAPQHKVRGQEAFEFSEGSDGALHTKIVDQNGNPISSSNKLQVADVDVKTELEQIKQQQQQILQRLNQPIDTQLTGRNIEEVYFFNAIAISTTDLIESDTIDLSKYKKITILARNSLNQEVGLYLDYRSANAGFMHVWENGSWKPRNNTSLKLPPTGGYSIFNLNSVWQELRYDPLKTIRLRAKCDNAPTSGALTVFVVGVIN